MLKERDLYQFGEFTLDATAKVVFRGGHPVRLTRKVVETLQVLVENGGQVVPKEEMLKAVWPDREVDEANLTQNIAVIRRTLGVGQGDPAHIETFPGRGYRLEGPVRTVQSTSTPGVGAPVALAPADEISASTVETAKGSTVSWLTAGVVVMLMAALAGWAYWSRGSATGAEPMRVNPITRLPGKEYQPALSADGKRLAFLWVREGKGAPSIWIQEMGDSTPRQVTREAGHYSSPSWSPDGRQLAAVRIGREASEVMIFDPATGAGRTVARLTPPDYGFDHRLLEWAPDGQSLVVSHSDGPENPMRLRRLRLADGVVEPPLTAPEAMIPGDVDPRFAPDGKTITFLRLFHRTSSELFAVTPGRQEKRLTTEERHISGHAWESAQTIVAGSNRSGEFLLWRMQVGPSLAIRDTKALGVYGEFPIQVSATAGARGQLVYSMLHQDRNIWRLDLGSKQWTRVIASTGQDASPQYSPDGEWVCFRSDRSGEEQLWLSRKDGSDAVQLTPRGSRPSVGRWSPDGQRVVFNNPHGGEMHLAERVEGTWKVKGLGVVGIHPVFAVDGKSIFAGQGNEILRYPVDGGAGVAAVKSKGLSMGVSPDGKFL
ncbi:MAG: PD40 domain-containing protein, partial [Bryobacterales bacterium]|nr:PD40 domain-containing protein [Bryobacterales bacterium]